MEKSLEESRREWRRALWVIVLAICGALAASLIGLMMFHALPPAR